MTDAALHASDSSEQRATEIAIIAAVSEIVAVPLAPARIAIGEARVEIDGASEDRSVLVEAYARVGALRGGQPKKLATDAFKLAWAGEKLGAQRLIIAIVGDEADTPTYAVPVHGSRPHCTTPRSRSSTCRSPRTYEIR